MPTAWITRHGTKRSGFRYRTADARPLTNRRKLERIDALRIPPAWRDVHIATSQRSAVQAWGIDAKGRKQYRYHARAVERGEQRKYHRVRRLALELPKIRARLAKDFRGRELTRERVAAAVVRLIGEGFFRIGSERYVKENGTFGISTMRKSHVEVSGSHLVFTYTGKRSITQRQVVVDAALSRFVHALRETPGRRLFRYRTAAGWADLTARDVNEYVQSLAGASYTAKDFRTWGGTLRMATILAEIGPASSEREAKRNVVLAVRLTAAELGNTPAICRKSYVHPIVVARYLDDGETITLPTRGPRQVSLTAHAPEERALIAFLAKHFPERRRRARSEERGARC